MSQSIQVWGIYKRISLSVPLPAAPSASGLFSSGHHGSIETTHRDVSITADRDAAHSTQVNNKDTENYKEEDKPQLLQ